MSNSAGRKVTSHSFVQHGESGWCSSQNSDFCHHHNDGGWLDCKLPRSAHAELAHPFTRQLGAGFADPGSRYRGDYCVAAVDGRECGAPESAHRSAPQPKCECGAHTKCNEPPDSACRTHGAGTGGEAMTLFSNQRWYCTACGARQESPMPQAMGREWKVCSRECLGEIKWREVLSMMGKEYRARGLEEKP